MEELLIRTPHQAIGKAIPFGAYSPFPHDAKFSNDPRGCITSCDAKYYCLVQDSEKDKGVIRIKKRLKGLPSSKTKTELKFKTRYKEGGEGRKVSAGG